MSNNIFIPSNGNTVNLKDLIGSESVHNTTTSLPQWLTVQDDRRAQAGGRQRGGDCKDLGDALKGLLKKEPTSTSSVGPVNLANTVSSEPKKEEKKPSSGGYRESMTSPFVGRMTAESATSPMNTNPRMGGGNFYYSSPSPTTPMGSSNQFRHVGGSQCPSKNQMSCPGNNMKELDTVTSLTNTSALEDKLKALFDEAQTGGKSRKSRKSKKSKKSKKGGSKKAKKLSGGKKKRHSKKSKKTEGGAKKGSRKKRSQSRTGDAPAEKKKRTIPAGFKAHLDFVKHIQTAMGLKGGPMLQKLGKYYKDLAKSQFPDVTDPVQLAKKAIEVFDKDHKSGKAKQKWDQISAK